MEIGPHLLGCRPSPPDDRDWRLADFLSGDPLDVALAALLAARAPAAATKAWAKIATERLKAVAPFPAPDPNPGLVVWENPEPVLDQGAYGTCVGNGWAQWGNTNPVDDAFAEVDARAIYYESTVIGGSPDDPDAPGGGQAGSTVRDGAKAMKNRSRLSAYAFAETVEEIRAWVQTRGPIVLGTDWHNDMFSPDAEGFVHPTGSVAGGHCYLLRGDSPAEDAALLQNSWGAGWGLSGYFKMKWADVRSLVEDSWGEACAAIELP